MTGYQRFKIGGSQSPPANLAKAAKDGPSAHRTLANLAALAGGKSQTKNLPPEPDEPALEERAAIAIELGGVPAVYADAFARLQCQKPMRVSDEEWRLAIDDGGRFLDQWGSLAVEFGWTPGDVFDVPRDGRSGLIWWLHGQSVRALGPQHAVAENGRAYDRETGRSWLNPYRGARQ